MNDILCIIIRAYSKIYGFSFGFGELDPYRYMNIKMCEGYENEKTLGKIANNINI